MILLISSSFLYYISFGLILIAILLSLNGRLSPTVTLGLVILIMISGFLLNALSEENNYGTNSPESTKEPPASVDSTSIEDSIETVENDLKYAAFDEVLPDPVDGKPDLGIKTTNREEPEKLVRKMDDWTYRIEGNWQWDKAFIKAFEDKTGMKKKGKGNIIISLNYTGINEEVIAEGVRMFEFKEGLVEVNVNHEYCCCKSIIKLPPVIAGKSLKIVNLEIQKAINELMLENEAQLIHKIYNCI